MSFGGTRRSVRRAHAITALLLAACSGCGLVLGLRDAIVDGDLDGGREGGLEEGIDDGSRSDDGPPRDGSPADAPSTLQRGPRCVPVANDGGVSFCIDETEVTTTQYLEMLAALTDAGQSAVEQLNAALAGTGCPPLASVVGLYPNSGGSGLPAPSELPINYVGWCQAQAFCSWAGKHMCGAIGGGTIDNSRAYTPAVDEWTFACTQGGEFSSPYGNTGICGACNENVGCDGGASDGAVAVKTFPLCRTASGVFDLTGNLDEWENSYQLDAAVSRRYPVVRGANYTTKPTDDCYFQHGTDWAAALKGGASTGIRCCR